MSGPGRLGERLLAELRRELRGFGRRARRLALDEARDHLLCAIEDEIARGATPAEAEERAVARFGDPAAVAASLRATRTRRSNRAVPIVAGVALMLGLLALPAGPVRENLAAQQADAAPLPSLSTAACVKAWNAVANARWRAYAVHLGARRASVGGMVGARLQKHRIVVVGRGCTVKLWLARQAGQWQNAIYVYGVWEHGTARYGTSWKHKAAPPHRARLRTPVQWSNARVQPDGALRFHVGASS